MRSYHAPGRTEQARATRERIRAAAHALFLEHGFGGTSMARIAAAAAVAEKTVYLAFPRKADLLSEIVRVAVRGDDDDARAADRREWDADAFVEFVEAALHRAARILRVAEAAAQHDPELAALRADGHASQLELCRRVAGGTAADVLFALTSEDVYLRLVDERGWSRRRYREWLRSALGS